MRFGGRLMPDVLTVVVDISVSVVAIVTNPEEHFEYVSRIVMSHKLDR